MLNKRTIMFFTDSYNTAVADSVAQEFAGDGTIVGITVTRKELQSAVYNKFIEKLLPKGGALRSVALNKRTAIKSFGMGKKQQKKHSYSNRDNIQRRMLNALNRYNPGVVVVTEQSVLSDLLAAIDRYGKEIKLAVVPEEYILDRRLVCSAVDYYFVDNFDMRNALMECGVSDDKVVICGLPVNKRFFADSDKRHALKKFGASGDRPVVLISASRAGDGRFKEVLEELRKADLGIDYIVACGQNRSLLNAARDAGFAAYNDGIDINAALTACDAVVMRPTTMLLAEAMAKNKEIFALLPVGKMESATLDYLGIDQITKINDPTELVGKLRAFRDIFYEIRAEEEPENSEAVAVERQDADRSSYIVANNLIAISEIRTEE